MVVLNKGNLDDPVSLENCITNSAVNNQTPNGHGSLDICVRNGHNQNEQTSLHSHTSNGHRNNHTHNGSPNKHKLHSQDSLNSQTSDENNSSYKHSLLHQQGSSNQTHQSVKSWPEGTILCWGSGKHGQHSHAGSGNIIFSNECIVDQFSAANRDAAVALVACGSSHTVIVNKSNEIFVWGNNHCGQLGCGDDKNQPVPTQISLYSVQRENPDIMGVACGARHTFIWLRNGNVFSFGDNMFAQLAYDIRIKDYRQNQKKPHLLRGLSHRHIQQVACGEKHTLFLFQGGHVAAVGNGSFGQLGNNERNEAVTAVNLRDIPPVKYVAAGAYQSVVIDVTGEVWCWGFGGACGRTKEEGDLLQPERCHTRHPNIVQVACGHAHNAALSANGSVYTWGQGSEGQLGHGQEVITLKTPTKVIFDSLNTRIANISCGENYTAVITKKGELYMWGKKSHVISNCSSSIPETQCYFTPQLVNTAANPLKELYCGAWHMAAIAGKPDWEKENNDSDNEDEMLMLQEDQTGALSEMEIDITSNMSRGDTRIAISREKTTISLADFYAPSPSPTFGRSTSPNNVLGKKQNHSYLQPRKQDVMLPNFTKKNPVVWKARPHKGKFPTQSKMGSELGPIEQQSIDSFDMKITKLESDSSKNVQISHTADEVSTELTNGSLTDNSNSNWYSLPKIKGANLVNTENSMAESNSKHSKKKNKSDDASLISSEDTASVISNKTHKTYKSHVTEKLQEKLALQQHTHTLEGRVPLSNYTHVRQPSPLKLRTNRSYISKKTTLKQLDYNPKKKLTQFKSASEEIIQSKHYSTTLAKTLTENGHKIGVLPPSTTTKIFIRSTRLDFVSPEPILSQHSPAHPLTLKRNLGRNSRHVTRSQPDITHYYAKENSFIGGRTSNDPSRNASSVQGTYPGTKQDIWTHASPNYRGSQTMKKLSNAPAIARQRLQAQQRIEKSLKDHTHSRSNASNINYFLSPDGSQDSRNMKRSYALPSQITFLANNLINRQNSFNPFNTQFLGTIIPNQGPKEELDYSKSRPSKNKTYKNSPIYMKDQ